MEAGPFRAMVSGLSVMGPVTLRGEAYAGEYLSMLVSIDPENPEHEAARTPQVIAELGRLTAAAYREKELREVDYRVWRETVAFEMANDVDAAANAGFESASAPGVDAKGNPKAAKCPSAADIESYVRTLPEYRVHYDRKLAAEETWSTLHAAYTAAQARTAALRGFASSGGVTQERDRAPARNERNEVANPEARYHPGDGDGNQKQERDNTPVHELESQAVGGARSPIPAPPPGARPGPPPRRT